MGWQVVNQVVLHAGNTIINPNGIFIYDGAPAAGNLMVSIAPAAGTDQFGNAYPRGEMVGKATDTAQVDLLSSGGGGAALVQFPINTLTLSNKPNVAGGVSGGGNAAELVLSGPALNAAGFKDWVQILMVSNDGVSTAANMEFIYVNNAQTASLTAFFNNAGWTFQVLVTMIAGLAVTGGLNTDTLITSGNLTCNGLATIGNGSSLNNLTLSPKMATPPNFPLSGSSTIAQIAACVNGIITSMQNHGMMT